MPPLNGTTDQDVSRTSCDITVKLNSQMQNTSDIWMEQIRAIAEFAVEKTFSVLTNSPKRKEVAPTSYNETVKRKTVKLKDTQIEKPVDGLMERLKAKAKARADAAKVSPVLTTAPKREGVALSVLTNPTRRKEYLNLLSDQASINREKDRDLTLDARQLGNQTVMQLENDRLAGLKRMEKWTVPELIKQSQAIIGEATILLNSSGRN